MLSRDWTGLRWRPVREQLLDKHSKGAHTLLLLTVEKIDGENFDFVVVVVLLLLPSSFFFLSFFFTLTHNLKSIRRTQTNLTPKDCTTLKDVPFLG